MAGTNYGVIVRSWVTGENVVGGLAGYNDGTIRRSHAAGSVTSPQDEVGGLVGDNNGDIEYSLSTATVSGRTRVGGLITTSQWTKILQFLRGLTDLYVGQEEE